MVLKSSVSGVHQVSCKRVLVVEDDEDSAELLRIVLTHAGYEVGVGHLVATALDMARLMKPHVAFVDLGLPDGDGYQLLAAFQADPVLRHCRFIATTGRGEPEDIARSLALGCDQHLTKPIGVDTVLAAVARCTGFSSSSNSNRRPAAG